MSQNPEMTALILAGGRSSRMGEDKAFLPWGEYTVIEFLIARLRPLFPSVAVVTKNPEKFGGLPVRVISDVFEESSSMIGLYSGLLASETEVNFVIPCDAPLMPTPLIRDLADLMESFEAVVLGGGQSDAPIPLPGFFRTTVLPRLLDRILTKEYQISNFLLECVNFSVPESIWRKFDPDGHSLINLNTKAEYRDAYELVESVRTFSEPSR